MLFDGGFWRAQIVPGVSVPESAAVVTTCFFLVVIMLLTFSSSFFVGLRDVVDAVTSTRWQLVSAGY